MILTRRKFFLHAGCGLSAAYGTGLLAGRAACAASAPHVHDTAALVAAQIAPEPFRSNWKACRGGSWPDYMRDQPVGHENQRVAGMLYTLEAIRYLRDGQCNKALLLASARSHYVADSQCIAHAAVWNQRAQDDILESGRPGRGPWSFLPADMQDYWLPLGERTPHGYYPIEIEPPPVFRQAWDSLVDRKLVGSMHAFFDQTHPLTPYPNGYPTDGVPNTTNWSAYDREFYGRWEAENIALTVLDRQSVLSRSRPIRFVAAEAFQKSLETEMRNMVASIATYYRYLTVAKKTRLVGDIEQLFPSSDRLALLARGKPKIYLSPQSPWPLKRACRLLAMEMVRAEYRTRGQLGEQYGERIAEETEALFSTVAMPDKEADRRVVIAWQQDAAAIERHAAQTIADTSIVCEHSDPIGGQIVLHGQDMQAAIHLVDYLLDLAYAPLHGRVPVEVLLTVLRREWEGMRLMERLATMTDAQVATSPHRPSNPHEHEQAAWADKVHRMVRPYTFGRSNISGPLPSYCNLLLKDLPLPNGQKVDLD